MEKRINRLNRKWSYADLKAYVADILATCFFNQGGEQQHSVACELYEAPNSACPDHKTVFSELERSVLDARADEAYRNAVIEFIEAEELQGYNATDDFMEKQ